MKIEMIEHPKETLLKDIKPGKVVLLRREGNLTGVVPVLMTGGSFADGFVNLKTSQYVSFKEYPSNRSRRGEIVGELRVAV